MSEAPALQCFYGGKDMLEAVGELRGMIEAGEVDGIVLIAVTAGGQVWSNAYRDDAQLVWARLLAATATAQHELLADGL